MTSMSKLEIRPVIKFCNDLGHTPTQIHQMMEKTGLKCSKRLVFNMNDVDVSKKEGQHLVTMSKREGRRNVLNLSMMSR